MIAYSKGSDICGIVSPVVLWSSSWQEAPYDRYTLRDEFPTEMRRERSSCLMEVESPYGKAPLKTTGNVLIGTIHDISDLSDLLLTETSKSCPYGDTRGGEVLFCGTNPTEQFPSRLRGMFLSELSTIYPTTLTFSSPRLQRVVNERIPLRFLSVCIKKNAFYPGKMLIPPKSSTAKRRCNWYETYPSPRG